MTPSTMQALGPVKDGSLWDRGRHGDAEALLELLGAVALWVQAFLRRKSVPPAEREDLVAEVLLDTLRYLRGTEPRLRNPSAFLYYRSRAVLRRYWDRSERRARTGSLGRVLGPDGALLAEKESADRRDPPDLVHERRLLDAYRSCLDAMPGELERVHRLLVDEDLSQAEIARRLGRNEVWVHRRVSEARAFLREALRRQGFLSG